MFDRHDVCTSKPPVAAFPFNTEQAFSIFLRQDQLLPEGIFPNGEISSRSFLPR
jgi:hypothetical protein